MMSDERERIAVIRRAQRVTLPMLKALGEISPLLLEASFSSKLTAHRGGEAANEIIAMARELSDATPEAILNSLSNQPDPAAWGRRWLEKAQRFPVDAPPLGEAFVPIRNADEMRRVACRYENCLATKVLACVLGREIYLEYVPGSVIVDLG